MNTDRQKRAEWAAKLIMDHNRDYRVEINGPDDVLVNEFEGRTPIAGTHTNEPNLLEALLKEIERRRP